jgi:hypothetical protein
LLRKKEAMLAAIAQQLQALAPAATGAAVE